jgi:hypothetical protein
MAKDKAYYQRHRWVCGVRGPAKNQRCEDCGRRACDWATIHGRAGTNDPADYRALCRSCHRLYDRSTQGERNPSARLTEQQVLAIWARRTEGSTALGREFGVCKGAIGNITSGRKWAWLTGAEGPGNPYRRRKLTDEQVREIRRRPGETAAALAREFGVSRRAIRILRDGETYRDVP